MVAVMTGTEDEEGMREDEEEEKATEGNGKSALALISESENDQFIRLHTYDFWHNSLTRDTDILSEYLCTMLPKSKMCLL